MDSRDKRVLEFVNDVDFIRDRVNRLGRLVESQGAASNQAIIDRLYSIEVSLQEALERVRG